MGTILKCIECGGSHDPNESCVKQRRWEARNRQRVRELTRNRTRRYRRRRAAA